MPDMVVRLPRRERNVVGWIHGDLDARNLLVRDGRLSAVLDFGSIGVGPQATRSPPRISMPSRFGGGVSGQAHRSSYEQDGL